MKILVANPGSTSYKCKLYDMTDMSILFRAAVERIGDTEGIYSYSFLNEEKIIAKTGIPDYCSAVNLTLQTLNERYNLKEISAVGFKTVLAKGVSGCVELNSEVVRAMKDYECIAPVHTNVYLTAISVFSELLNTTPLIGLFETHFHTKIRPEAFMYGIPYELYEKYGIRKYGFHGASHSYIGMRVKELYSSDKIISCHLGGSSSVCAIKDGYSIDTSMGMSPQSGLLNAKRVGDLDSFALLYLMEQEKLSIDETRNLLLSKSGLAGISGTSGDLRDIEEKMLRHEDRSELAFKTFAYYVRRYIGEYLAVLNGADCIAFTGGIGQNSFLLRKEILKDMENLGIVLDDKLNSCNPQEGIISDANSKTKIAVIPTNEEFILAQQIGEYLRSVNNNNKY